MQSSYIPIEKTCVCVCVCVCGLYAYSTVYIIMYVYKHVCVYTKLMTLCMRICWPLLSNQSFSRQIVGYVMGVDDHRAG